MDNTEEPQKKVFKARKTMKASDRQQLEAVHKAKEELLKPTEFKLVNGNHENGDSDINSPHNDTDYMADKKELNGIIDVSIDSHEVPIVKLSDIKEDFRNLDQTRDLKVKLDEQPSESIACQEDTDNVAVSEVRVQVSNNKDGVQCEEKSTVFGRVDQSAPDGLTLEEEKVTCDTEPSEEKTQLSVPGQLPLEEESSTVLEGTHEVKEEKHKEEADEEQLAQETLDMLTESQEDKELEVDSLEESLDAQGEDAEDGDVKDDILEEDILEEDQPKETKVNQEDEQQDTLGADEDTEEELTIKQGSDDLMVGQETGETLEMVEEEGDCAEEEKEVLEMHSEEQDAGEEAISSSMEIDQNQKDEEQKSDLPETTFEKSDLQTGSVLESTDSMETDDIIPILEKLAPVEDEMQCFSKTDLHSESAASPDEEKTEHCLSSPSKQESSETLPSEAFLVLSDEEEPCDVAPSAEEKASSPQGESSDILEKPAEKQEEQKKEENEEEPHAEKSEGPRRKRSKSEDLDSQHSKRRRYEEEYEAELQLKITAGDDLNKKLQKVVQELLEEKLSALQCAVFDKTLADLKNRVEKIECKKHETVLNAIQAKIARLTKRFGAAKEDLKKRPEQTTTTQPASPGKPANEMSANGNLGTYRNANTVRQMLESKRNVGDIVTTTFTTSATGQPPISPVPSLPPPSNVPLRTPNTTQLPATQSPANNTLQGRAPPDWKLIQQRINATSIAAPQNLSSQPKLSPPATSASVMTTSVLPAPSTATVVGNSQSQLLQGTTGTLVTNQQSGSVEFIPAQNQAAVSGLNKTSPVSLAPTKPMNSPSISSPGIQRNSPANSGSMGTPLSVQAVTTTHSIVQSSRSSLPVVGTSAIYTQAGNRNSLPMKVPLSGFNSPSTETPIAPRPEPQTNRTPTAESVASKRAAESTTQGGKPGGGVIDLTLDDEDDGSSQESRRINSAGIPGSVQSPQVMNRPSQPPQPNTLQSTSVPPVLPSQATIHVLPTAQTTVNITQRPGTQTSTRVSGPRTPNSHQLVYTTTALPTTPVQTPVRNTVMQGQNLRQVSPQTGGVTVRMPQTTAYVVNNGMSINSAGPQLTVHHRPPQEQARPIHPAPLPEAPQPQRLPPEAATTSAPQKPHLKLARVQSQNGIVLSWSVLEVDRSCANVDSYHLYAYHEDPAAISPSQWKKIGEVKALPLPMACTLTQFVSGSKYYFAVRAKDIYGRFGPFCDPQSTDVISTQSS
ncbi:hypothetical protein FKM82_017453 [Ascaphus truei]